MRQRTLFEVVDLSKGDSDEDTIHVRPPASATKRKRARTSDENDARQCKAARLTSATEVRRKVPAINFSANDSDSIQCAAPRSQRSSRSAKTSPIKTSRSSIAKPQTRPVLGELTPAKFQNQLRGPIAWFRPPIYKTGFLSQFSRSLSPPIAQTRPPARKRSLSNGVTSSRGRPVRAAARRSYVSLVSSPDASEDELAAGHRASSRRQSENVNKTSSTQNKTKAKRDFDDADFLEVSEASDEGSDESDINVDDSSSVQPSESEDDHVDIKASKSKPSSKSSTKAKPQKAGAGTTAKTATRTTAKSMVNMLKKTIPGLDMSLPPMSDIRDIFQDMTARALELGFDKAVAHLQKCRPLRVATMCSGTESPLLGLDMIKESLGSGAFEVEHLFSAELVAFKQAYIERNFAPPIIFRDITEMIDAFKDQEKPMATTAYGAKVPIPLDLDMLIAGTSCVDYSGMNSRKKGIHDGGESGDTWRAVMDFCIAARPAVVLLENVKGAPWDDMLDQYKDIGYEPVGALVNTKDYYIPHIRQRGYMACFDREKLSSAGLSKATASKWASLMDDFKRPASSPVSDFLLPNDRIARQQFRADEPGREVDWSQCEITQMQYRQKMRLGNARPITHWSESGSMLVPDNGHAQWYQNQVERVLDTIDAAHLRKALSDNGMYDNRFKTRVVDLSQNVHREQDHRPFGIVGCITPSGMFFVSDAGRQLTSEETLKLQGLPLDRISFTTESPADVQDLAGNAMSTTVISSSILSALIVGHKMILTGTTDKGMTICEDEGQRTRLERGDTEIFSFSSELESGELPGILNKAERSLRRCYCEGSMGMASKTIQQCVDCGHTTCMACGGNPRHNYRQQPLLSNTRLSAADFDQELRSILPLRLKLCEDETVIQDALNGMTDLRYRERVSRTMMGMFSFQGVRRTHCWTVIYQADGANLDLVIDSEAIAEWRLYAHSPKQIAGNDKLRSMLQQPIARSRLRGSLFSSCWEIRVPQQRSLPTRIVGSGSRLPSRWARNAMPDFKDHFVWENLAVTVDDPVFQAVNGVYRHLPHCGMANDSLYKRVDEQDGESLYLFLDPTRTGDPKEDCFVFSRDHAVLEYDEIRPVLARLTSPWRAWSTDGQQAGIPTTTKAKLIADDVWRALPADVKLVAADTDIKIRVPVALSDLVGSVDCSTAVTLVSCAVPSEESITMQASQPEFFEKHAWLFEAMRRYLPAEEWFALSDKFAEHQCGSCSPTRPELRWALSDKNNIVAHEDPSCAAAYERAIKSRPESFLVTTGMAEGALDVGINFTSLAHRAGARLRHRLDLNSTVSYSWRLTTSARHADTFIFKAFRLSSTTGVEPCTGDFGLTIDLFPKQRLALAWMLRQEDGVQLRLEEVEEAALPSVGWQAEVKAETCVTIKGGICADHPGFGKTILTLALTSSEWRSKDMSGIVSDLRQSSRATGLIPLAATLIICPAALLRQWQSEVSAKLQDKRKVITINAVGDLSKHTITDFETATFILVNRTVLGKDDYAERLAVFAGVPGPATKSGRAFAHWLQNATQDIPTHLEILNRGFGLKALQRHLKEVYKSNLESDKFKMNVPSRRLRGRNYVAGKDRSKTSAETKAATSDIDVSQVGKPLLEMFFFNRIMVDEFHTYESKERAAIAALKADKRWGLSATPAMDDFYDVAQTAGLLGIPLRTSNGARGVMKTKNARDMKKELTSFELFDMMRTMPSDSMHAHIHAVDQRFLDGFVRRNIMDFNEQLVYHEHLVPVQLDNSHMALYAEISQHLNSLDMRIKKSTKTKATDRQQRFHSVIDECLTAEEALSKAAAFPDGEERELDDIILLRQQQIEEMLMQLPGVLRAASSKESEAFADWKQSRLEGGVIGDRDTIQQISDCLKRSVSTVSSAKKSKKTSAQSDDDASEKGHSTGKREITAKLNDMCVRLAKAKRSARYLENVKRICLAKAGAKGPPDNACPHQGCENKIVDSDEAGVSVLCGHLICRQCYTRMKQEGASTCPADGCSESMEDIHLLWSKKMGDSLKPATAQGAKAEAAIKLLRRIEEQRDQAILFVQYQEQLDVISDALEEAGISGLVVKSAKEAGDQVDKFCGSAGTKNQVTALVLNASDETAAGLNLQNANHVIFLSPLLRDTQYGYDSTMAQAIGRVRRYGQKKDIHVNRIFALDTIDVDILEHRERRNAALTEQDAPEVVQPTTMKEMPDGSYKKEKTQLVSENGHFSLRPQSWLVRCGEDDVEEMNKVKGKNRVLGWEDFTSLVKFSKTFTEDDDW